MAIATRRRVTTRRDATPTDRPTERTRAQSGDDDAESRTAASGWRDVDSRRAAFGRAFVRSFPDRVEIVRLEGSGSLVLFETSYGGYF